MLFGTSSCGRVLDQSGTLLQPYFCDPSESTRYTMRSTRARRSLLRPGEFFDFLPAIGHFCSRRKRRRRLRVLPERTLMHDRRFSPQSRETPKRSISPLFESRNNRETRRSRYTIVVKRRIYSRVDETDFEFVECRRERRKSVRDLKEFKEKSEFCTDGEF